MDGKTEADEAIRVGRSRIEVHIERSHRRLSRPQIEGWVTSSAEMIRDYFGAFPVPRLRVEVVPTGFGGVGFGQHFRGRRLRVRIGRSTDERDLEADWVMVHEMLHAAFPDLRRRHRWMQEGLSTYLESVLRARAAVISEESVWARWMRKMPYGLPARGDRGLDRTHTWGRTYWGGALYWMMVDIGIRRRTDNRKSLRHAVRGILAAGGNGRVTWSTRRVVAIGDRATGTTTMSDLYEHMAVRPGTVDLEALFAELGVRAVARGRVELDDDAPLASIRRAMNRRR